MTPFLLLQSKVVNLKNLALLICHLFIDGQFRIGHLLYDESATPVDKFAQEIVSICPRFIPWMSTDVSANHSQWQSADVVDDHSVRLPWKPNERTDHILQLIFLDSQHFTKIDNLVAFYHIFIFNYLNEPHLKRDVSMVRDMELSHSLIMHYNRINGAIRIQWVSASESHYRCSVDSNPIYIHDPAAERVDFFEMIFGIYKRNWMTSINFAVTIEQEKHKKLQKLYETWDGNQFFANFLISNIKSSYINQSTLSYGKSITVRDFQMKPTNPRRFYKELSMDYQQIDRGEIRNQQKLLNLDLNSYVPADLNDVKRVSLYPHHTTELSVIFIYGNDFKRETGNPIGAKLLPLLGWQIPFIISGAIVLCFIRRIAKLRRDGFISTLIDMSVIFMGGGKLRIDHKIERLFFASMSVATLLLGGLVQLYPTFMKSGNLVNSYAELAKINPPIFFGPLLKQRDGIVLQMLKHKIGPNVNYAGIESIFKLLKEHNESFAFITERFASGHLKIITQGNRDLNVIQESLGSLPSSYFLRSTEYIPKCLKDEIEKTTSSMVENGLHDFYGTFTTYLTKLRGHLYIKVDDEDHRALSMEQFIGPVVGCCIWLIFAVTVFVIELIVHKLNQRRSRRVRRVTPQST